MLKNAILVVSIRPSGNALSDRGLKIALVVAICHRQHFCRRLFAAILNFLKVVELPTDYTALNYTAFKKQPKMQHNYLALWRHPRGQPPRTLDCWKASVTLTLIPSGHEMLIDYLSNEFPRGPYSDRPLPLSGLAFGEWRRLGLSLLKCDKTHGRLRLTTTNFMLIIAQLPRNM